MRARLHAQLLSHVWLFVTLLDYGPPGSSVHVISKARILQWAAIPFFKGSSQPTDWIHVSCVSCIGRRILYHWATWEVPTMNKYLSLITSAFLFKKIQESGVIEIIPYLCILTRGPNIQNTELSSCFSNPEFPLGALLLCFILTHVYDRGQQASFLLFTKGNLSSAHPRGSCPSSPTDLSCLLCRKSSFFACMSLFWGSLIYSIDFISVLIPHYFIL